MAESTLLLSFDTELKKTAMAKSKALFGIPLSTLLKLFTRAFVEQKNVGFYLGDAEFNECMRKMVFQKRMTRLMTRRRKLIRADRFSVQRFSSK